MGLPSDIKLPLRVDYSKEEDLDRYLRDLVFELQSMYENIANNVNGFIRSDTEIDQAQWQPTLQGAIAGNFTYGRQVGWAVRKGIFTELFFDVSWTATTATGGLYLELPYRVTISAGYPFHGHLRSSGITYGAGYTYLSINALPDTFQGNIGQAGSGLASAQLNVPASGEIFGHISYIGISDE